MIRESDGAYFPFHLELEQRAPVILERGAVLGGPVHLVEIDALDAEAGERRLELTADAPWVADAPRLDRVVAFVPHEAGLGEDKGSVVRRDVAQRTGDDLLGMSESVDR